jgi:leader peptidase (prepilin peptidase) / N-methyltransferase
MDTLTLISIIPVILAGLILGSFFNVLIWRLPRDESIVWPASHCPRCGRTIRPWENIPVLSYLLLRGKCAGCKGHISLTYPLIEIVTTLTAVLLWFTLLSPSWNRFWPHDVHLVLQCFVLLLMIPIAVIDIQHFIIPNQITFPFLGIGLAASFLPFDPTPATQFLTTLINPLIPPADHPLLISVAASFLASILGVLAGGGVLFMIGWIGGIIFKKEAMGWGDIKMMAMVGAIWGPGIAFYTFVFGAFLGAIVGVTQLVMRKLGKEHYIPFGPYLGAGLFLAVLAGDRIASSYMLFVNSLIFR